MKFLDKTYYFVASFKMVKVIMFCVLTLSSTVGFSQTDPLEEDPYVEDTAYDGEYGLGGTPSKNWIVARHIGGWWLIRAIDAVTGDFLTGIRATNLAVNYEGTLIGEFRVLNKWGYDVTESGSTTVGVACQIKMSFAGFPPISGNYSREHTYSY